MVHTLAFECAHIQSGERPHHAKGWCKACYVSKHKNHKANSKKWRDSPKGKAYERKYNEDRHNFRNLIRDQQATIHSLAAEVTNLRKRVQEDTNKINKLESTILEMERKIITLEGQLEQKESTLSESETQLEQALAELERTRDTNGVLLARIEQIEIENSLKKTTKEFISHLFEKYTKHPPGSVYHDLRGTPV